MTPPISKRSKIRGRRTIARPVIRGNLARGRNSPYEPCMSNAHDRRGPGMGRMPFDAMVEVGGALGPSFEAQAVNLSEDGMHLRTAYLPEIGQPVSCRFDAGSGL